MHPFIGTTPPAAPHASTSNTAPPPPPLVLDTRTGKMYAERRHRRTSAVITPQPTRTETPLRPLRRSRPPVTPAPFAGPGRGSTACSRVRATAERGGRAASVASAAIYASATAASPHRRPPPRRCQTAAPGAAGRGRPLLVLSAQDQHDGTPGRAISQTEQHPVLALANACRHARMHDIEACVGPLCNRQGKGAPFACSRAVQRPAQAARVC